MRLIEILDRYPASVHLWDREQAFRTALDRAALRANLGRPGSGRRRHYDDRLVRRLVARKLLSDAAGMVEIPTHATVRWTARRTIVYEWKGIRIELCDVPDAVFAECRPDRAAVAS
jgi:hypothetical protein